ncbi:MAG: S-methyl-5-thioribose-1-phosphate isomerase [Candidatus Woesearchaeota archaeon]|nr:S-methyl-5-thioribose-1-phosphate isomerase [Candidatus Woesearchaeota archaeon]
MEINDYVKNIKELKVQGAEMIARFAVGAVRDTIVNSKAKSTGVLYNELLDAKRKLSSARPTEPCMFNSLKYVFMNVNTNSVVELTRNLLERIDFVLNHFDSSQEIIAHIASQKIKNGSIVFTHCHSSTVMDVLKEAKKQKKRFEVYNTETRPRFQGRVTAQELSEAGIPVTHFVDSAARYALKHCDIALVGADAITSEGKVVNKIGSELFAEVAKKFEVPFYSCTDSWKFDVESIFGYEKNLEMRSEKEVWENAPKGVKINNYAFEKISPELISGIISELGIYRPDVFIHEIKNAYPWLFI